jgi:hypothetical protein
MLWLPVIMWQECRYTCRIFFLASLVIMSFENGGYQNIFLVSPTNLAYVFFFTVSVYQSIFMFIVVECFTGDFTNLVYVEY